ncbi:transcription initiation protein [Spirosoma aureum]|uniref:Transcription initiation protein n=1 Tax=Spirosoma aureum TaxID=2692134 RepID=A0A6G9ARR9_9BACT|nr:YciI family protein [Spirosoma aureum]QIP15026.1 transcription initiation protein [Spirosoma aureum]
MTDFLLLFRSDYKTKDGQPSPEVTQVYMNQWQEWFNNLAGQDLLAWPVQWLDPQGKVIRQGNADVDGAYDELNESIVGLTIIKASDYEAAIHVARNCPIFDIGGTVEIRQGN